MKNARYDWKRGVLPMELIKMCIRDSARAVRTLADGCIGPDPRGGDPCGYCPVLACEKRMGA